MLKKTPQIKIDFKRKKDWKQLSAIAAGYQFTHQLHG